jgi:ABC-2 type transport system permease protein
VTTIAAVRPSGSALTPFRSPGTVIGRLVFRRTWRSAAIWAVIFGGYTVAKALGIVDIYPNAAALHTAAVQLASDPGLNTLVGAPRYLDSLAGMLQWNIASIMVTLGAIWALLTSTKHLRGEEDAGRWEILLTGQTTARGAAVNVLAGLFASTLLLFAIDGVFFVATGSVKTVHIDPGPAVLLALDVALGCGMFAAIGALMSQLLPSRGRAAGLTAGVLGVSFALRSMGDITSASWLLNVTPLGWLEQFSPLTHTSSFWILPPLALILACGSLSVFLAGRRDLGSGVITVSDSSRPHTRLLNSPLAAAVRLTRTSTVVWLAAFTVVGGLYASFTNAAVSSLAGSASAQQIFQHLVHTSTAVFAGAYLGLAFFILLTLICVYAANAVGAIRDEEASGRVDNFLVQPVSRLRWLAGRGALVVLVIVVSGLLGAIGSWVGLGSQGNGISFTTLLQAGVNATPPALFIFAVGIFALGFWPRRTIIAAYAVLGWSFLVVMLSSGISIPTWIQDTSLLHHIVFAPAAPPDWGANAVIIGIAVVLCAAGAVRFNRRDLQGE